MYVVAIRCAGLEGWRVLQSVAVLGGTGLEWSGVDCTVSGDTAQSTINLSPSHSDTPVITTISVITHHTSHITTIVTNLQFLQYYNPLRSKPCHDRSGNQDSIHFNSI